MCRGEDRKVCRAGKDGIEGRIDLFGSCDRSLQQLLGADLALGDESGEGDGIVLAIFFEPHGLRISKSEPIENDYSYSDLATSFFMISVMGPGPSRLRISRRISHLPRSPCAPTSSARSLLSSGQVSSADENAPLPFR
jgi:hypothetical protein